MSEAGRIMIMFLIVSLLISSMLDMRSYTITQWINKENARNSAAGETNHDYLRTCLHPRIIRPGSAKLNITLINVDNVPHNFAVSIITPFFVILTGESISKIKKDGNLTTYYLHAVELSAGGIRIFILNVSVSAPTGVVAVSLKLSIRLFLDGSFVEEKVERLLLYCGEDWMPWRSRLYYKYLEVEVSPNTTVFGNDTNMHIIFRNPDPIPHSYRILIRDHTGGLLHFSYHNRLMEGIRSDNEILYQFPLNKSIKLAPQELIKTTLKIKPMKWPYTDYIKYFLNLSLLIDDVLNFTGLITFEVNSQQRTFTISKITAISDGYFVQLRIELMNLTAEQNVIGAVQLNGSIKIMVMRRLEDVYEMTFKALSVMLSSMEIAFTLLMLDAASGICTVADLVVNIIGMMKIKTELKPQRPVVSVGEQLKVWVSLMFGNRSLEDANVTIRFLGLVLRAQEKEPGVYYAEFKVPHVSEGIYNLTIIAEKENFKPVHKVIRLFVRRAWWKDPLEVAKIIVLPIFSFITGIWLSKRRYKGATSS